MKNAHSRIALIKEAISLEQQRSTLHAKLESMANRLAAITQELAGGGGQRPAAASSSLVGAKAPRRGKVGSGRGELSSAILATLKSAGDQGVRVQHMAERFGVKVRNLFVWFSTTGRKFRQIKKVAPGHYRLAKGA